MKSMTYSSNIPSDIKYVGVKVDEVIHYLESLCDNIDDGNLFESRVILNELLLNAVRHGNREDCTKSVAISAGVTKGGEAYFIIEDEGEGYDYQCLMERKHVPLDAMEVCSLKENGRGILIVLNLCDRIKFNKKGNKVVILKKLHN